MSDKIIKIEILKAIKENLKLNEIQLNKLFTTYKIDVTSPDTIRSALKKARQEFDGIEIPGPIRYDERFNVVKTNPVTNWGDDPKHRLKRNKTPVYSIPDDEFMSRVMKKGILNLDISYLEKIEGIVNYYNSDKSNKSKSEIEQSEGALISSILNIILGNDLKKYSLRKLETALKKTGFNIDHNTLQTKFKNENFQFFLIAGIMRKKGQVKKEVEKGKLKSFENWFNDSYMKVKGKNISNKFNASEGKEEPNDFIDNIGLD